MDEKRLEQLLKQDLSDGTDAFRDALLGSCLDVLCSENDAREVDEDDLELLAAAGDVYSAAGQFSRYTS